MKTRKHCTVLRSTNSTFSLAIWVCSSLFQPCLWRSTPVENLHRSHLWKRKEGTPQFSSWLESLSMNHQDPESDTLSSVFAQNQFQNQASVMAAIDWMLILMIDECITKRSSRFSGFHDTSLYWSMGCFSFQGFCLNLLCSRRRFYESVANSQ
jgi:hypothetical protein